MNGRRDEQVTPARTAGELSPQAARQGATPHVTRYVLAVGTILAVAALGIVLALYGL
jgi:hypothetical protein